MHGKQNDFIVPTTLIEDLLPYNVKWGNRFSERLCIVVIFVKIMAQLHKNRHFFPGCHNQARAMCKRLPFGHFILFSLGTYKNLLGILFISPCESFVHLNVTILVTNLALRN